MLQLLQNLKNGKLTLAELPLPQVKSGHVLIQTTTSLVSIGTEKMLLDFGRSNLFEKAKKQPDKVKQVLQKIKTDGLASTLESVQNKLDTPLPLGYSNVGHVIEVGDGVSDFAIGDRVLSNGAHADHVLVPKHLCAKIPDSVSDAEAAFTVTGAIALQGIRLLAPQLGETVAVVGLGLIGLLAVQLLKANGCTVIGYDFDAKKLDLAKSWGAETVHLGRSEDPTALALAATKNRGVDGVLITASTTSSDPLHLSCEISRQRGKIVLVGVIGSEWSRADFYKKELSFQVSCSYGPGRYDPFYEEKGQDYPFGFVRWTENRNFHAFLELLSNRSLDLSSLIDKTIPFSEATEAYTEILADSSLIGVLFSYPIEDVPQKHQSVTLSSTQSPIESLGISFVGAGSFSKAILLPNLKKLQSKFPFEFIGITSQTGISANHLGKKFGFQTQFSDVSELVKDPRSQVAFVTTHHQSHAKYTLLSLECNQSVFVEKPLCLTVSELETIQSALSASPNARLMVGFNRRYSPHIQKIKSVLASDPNPISMSFLINAGAIPMDHWTQQEVGGGRIIGEAVHFIDLARYLAASPIQSIQAVPLGKTSTLDVATIQIQFENGSVASVHYWANGHRGFPKERISVFASGKVFEVDNFRRLTAFGVKAFSSFKTSRQDKGHPAMLEAWLKALKVGGPSPIAPEEIFEVSRAAILALESAKSGGTILSLLS